MDLKDLAHRIEFELVNGFPKKIDIQSKFGIWHVAAFHNGKFYLLASREVERSEVDLYISEDGEEFTPYEENPVFRVGKAGEFDDARIEPHGLLFYKDKWLLYYGGYSWNFNRPIIRHFSRRGKWRVGLAQSSDLIRWEKHPSNPIFSKNTHIADPRVVYFKDRFFLYYLTSKPGCHVAYSDDGLRWLDYPKNPILDKIVASFLIRKGVIIGFCRWDLTSIGVVLSNDGFNWIHVERGPIIKLGMIYPWDSSGVAWPFVVNTGEALHLYYPVIDEHKVWRMAVAKIYMSL
jgi:predicted GH43/DUF377 family glycosyl hydrolase